MVPKDRSQHRSLHYTYPNYDVSALSKAVCGHQAWRLDQVRFYTGVSNASDDAYWNRFWAGKLRTVSRQGCNHFRRPLRCREKTVRLPGGREHTFSIQRIKPRSMATVITASFRASSVSRVRRAFRRLWATGSTAGPRCTGSMLLISTGSCLRKVPQSLVSRGRRRGPSNIGPVA
jgi:hypothetical protein